jgi:hypothetical protein
MDQNKTKLNEDEEGPAFKEFEADEEIAESMELDSYNSDSDFEDGFEKIHKQTELYKKLTPSHDDEDEDEDDEDEDDDDEGELLSADGETVEEDEDDHEWVGTKERNETVTFVHGDDVDLKFRSFTEMTTRSTPFAEETEAGPSTLAAAPKKARRKVAKKKTKKKAGKKKITGKKVKKKTSKKAGKTKTKKKAAKKKISKKKKAGKSPAKKKAGKKKAAKKRKK